MTQTSQRIPMDSKPRAENLIKSGLERSFKLQDLWELTRPRLSMLCVITAIVGYLIAQPQRDLALLACLIVGTSLAAGGSAALNQWLERDADARMVRTKSRPLPSGSVSPNFAMVYGLVLCVGGDLILWTGTNLLAASLALITQLSYLLAYTPLKRHSPWCTELGTIPGAIPPLIGWAAAEGSISVLGWLLFIIMICWQIPHFMAIAWTYRRDYVKGGLLMITVTEPSGDRAARQSLVFTVGLLAASLLPTFFGFTTICYGLVAFAAGLWMLYRALKFWKSENRDHAARQLFISSIGYLPLLLAALVLDRWFLV